MTDIFIGCGIVAGGQISRFTHDTTPLFERCECKQKNAQNGHHPVQSSIISSDKGHVSGDTHLMGIVFHAENNFH